MRRGGGEAFKSEIKARWQSTEGLFVTVEGRKRGRVRLEGLTLWRLHVLVCAGGRHSLTNACWSPCLGGFKSTQFHMLTVAEQALDIPSCQSDGSSRFKLKCILQYWYLFPMDFSRSPSALSCPLSFFFWNPRHVKEKNARPVWIWQAYNHASLTVIALVCGV